MSIPGTHNSGTYDIFLSTAVGFAKCQDRSITDQMNAGIRFLDIRCRHIENAFAIHHGQVYANINFDDVLRQVRDFLSANPTEIVLMRVSNEHDAQDNTRSFTATFQSYVDKYPNLFWLNNGNNDPTLGLIRGKVVVLRDGPRNENIDGKYGLAYGGNFNIQDNCEVSTAEKKLSVAEMFEKTKNGQKRVINYLSGYSINLFTLKIPKDMAKEVNPLMSDLIVKNKPAYVGIIPADFTTDDLIDKVVGVNLCPSAGRYWWCDAAKDICVTGKHSCCGDLWQNQAEACNDCWHGCGYSNCIMNKGKWFGFVVLFF